jgi:prophage regulatory protein
MSTESTFLRLRSLKERIQTSGPTIWRWVREGKFPKPIKLGPRTSAWRESDIELWAKDPMHWESESRQSKEV